MPAPNSPSMTFGTLISRIQDSEELSNQARQDMCSALRAFARIAGVSPEDIVADPAVVRSLRSKAPWQLADISKSRWANINASVGRAMQFAGVNVARQRRNFKPSPVWTDVLEGLAKRDRRDLNRFAGWCSIHEIEPQNVCSKTFDAFMAFMVDQSTQRRPRERAHVARRAWNRSVVGHHAWAVTIPAPEPIGKRAMAWDEFPETLHQEIQQWRAWATTVDPIDDDRKPLKPVTVSGYDTRLRILASTLVRGGMPVDQLDTLASLLTPAVMKRGMTLWLNGANELTDAHRQNLHSIVIAGLSAARFIGIPNEDVGELRKLAKKVRFVAQGMCDKNKERLRTLFHPKAKLAILNLPLAVRNSLADTKNPSLRDAQRMQWAIVLEILLKVPLRIRNAAELDLATTIARPSGGLSGNWQISIPDYGVKNAVAINAELKGNTSALVAEFVDRFRPVLAKGHCTRLFLTQRGTAFGASALSKQLAAFVRRETGIIIHAHLMRHFAAHLYLFAHPGDYETVRRILGHKSIETTILFYAGLSAEQSVGAYDDIVEKLRGEHAATVQQGKDVL